MVEIVLALVDFVNVKKEMRRERICEENLREAKFFPAEI
jgi:hypothetical protein